MKFGLHLDFHTPANVRVNQRPDVEGMAEVAKESGVDEVITYAKCHVGYAYYPTKVGTVHPQMHGDAFGEALAAFKKKNLKVLCYVSFGIDGQAATQHPKYARREKLVEINGYTNYIYICPFSGYTEDHFLPMIREIVELYDVDGFFFDTMGAYAKCYCPVCVRDIEKVQGMEIPVHPEDPGWELYGRFRRERTRRNLESICSSIHQQQSDLTIIFNQLGTARFPEPLPEELNTISLDYLIWGPQSLQTSLYTSYGVNTGVPNAAMCTLYNHGWGDWTPRSKTQIEQVLATTRARDCRIYIGARTHPENRLDAPTRDIVLEAGKIAERYREGGHSEDAKMLSDILILHNEVASYGLEDEDYHLEPEEHLKSLKGAHLLCLEGGFNAGILPERNIALLQCDQLLIIPEICGISEHAQEVIREHLENGGRVLMTGTTGTTDGKMREMAGIQIDAQAWQDHIYAPQLKSVEGKYPVLFRSSYHPVRLGGAEAVSFAIQPFDCVEGIPFGWGVGPYSDELSSHPILTRRSVGKGEIWHLAVDVFEDYALRGSHLHLLWFRDLIAMVQESFRVRNLAAPAPLEIVYHENDESAWIYLINHGGERMCSVKHPWSTTNEVLPAYHADLRITLPQGRTVKEAYRGKEPIGFSYEGKDMNIKLRCDSACDILRLDW